MTIPDSPPPPDPPVDIVIVADGYVTKAKEQK